MNGIKSFKDFLSEMTISEASNFDKELKLNGFTVTVKRDSFEIKDPDGKQVSDIGFDDDYPKDDAIEYIVKNTPDFIGSYKQKKLADFVGRLPPKWKKDLDKNDNIMEITTNSDGDRWFYLFVNGNKVTLTHDDGTKIKDVRDWKEAVTIMKEIEV